jgi:hypothetical protein
MNSWRAAVPVMPPNLGLATPALAGMPLFGCSSLRVSSLFPCSYSASVPATLSLASRGC